MINCNQTYTGSIQCIARNGSCRKYGKFPEYPKVVQGVLEVTVLAAIDFIDESQDFRELSLLFMKNKQQLQLMFLF